MKPDRLAISAVRHRCADDYALLLMLAIHKARDTGHESFAAALVELLRNHLADVGRLAAEGAASDRRGNWITPARAGVGTSFTHLEEGVGLVKKDLRRLAVRREQDGLPFASHNPHADAASREVRATSDVLNAA